MTAETLTLVRELDSRVTHGMQVRMLWSEADDTVWVAVVDTRGGGRFRLRVRPGERPRDVFDHPFAYADLHGVDPGSLSGRNDTAGAPVGHG
jgi:hypothetical protein